MKSGLNDWIASSARRVSLLEMCFNFCSHSRYSFTLHVLDTILKAQKNFEPHDWNLWLPLMSLCSAWQLCIIHHKHKTLKIRCLLLEMMLARHFCSINRMECLTLVMNRAKIWKLNFAGGITLVSINIIFCLHLFASSRMTYSILLYQNKKLINAWLANHSSLV